MLEHLPLPLLSLAVAGTAMIGIPVIPSVLLAASSQGLPGLAAGLTGMAGAAITLYHIGARVPHARTWLRRWMPETTTSATLIAGLLLPFLPFWLAAGVLQVPKPHLLRVVLGVTLPQTLLFGGAAALGHTLHIPPFLVTTVLALLAFSPLLIKKALTRRTPA